MSGWTHAEGRRFREARRSQTQHTSRDKWTGVHLPQLSNNSTTPWGVIQRGPAEETGDDGRTQDKELRTKNLEPRTQNSAEGLGDGGRNQISSNSKGAFQRGIPQEELGWLLGAAGPVALVLLRSVDKGPRRGSKVIAAYRRSVIWQWFETTESPRQSHPAIGLC